MINHSRATALVAILALVPGASPALGKALEDRNWIEVRTANFRISSLLGEKETLKLARHLEVFRAAVFVVTNINSTDASIPTVIYALRGRSDFKNLGIDENMAGIFMPGLRNNTILIRDARGMQETSTMLHEYVHFLVRNHGSLVYPRWFDEGFAEYLSATRVRGGYFQIGLFAKDRKESLTHTRWISMHKILAAEEYYDKWTSENKSMFYAEAWALAHYLQKSPGRRNDMAQYIKLVASGKEDIEAFEEAFDMKVSRLNEDVRTYVKKGRFKFFQFQTNELLPAFKADVAKLSREQVSLGLAKIALERGELDHAEHWFTIALTQELTRPRAEAGLGDVLKFRGEFEAAQPRFEQAVTLAPNDPYSQLDLAEYWHYRAMQAKRRAEREEFLESARSHYVKAWKLDESTPETYAMYGQTFLMQGKYDTAIEMLEEAESLLPSNLSIRLILAEAYAGAGRNEEAIEAARSVMAWSHEDGDAAKRAEEVLAHLDSSAE